MRILFFWVYFDSYVTTWKSEISQLSQISTLLVYDPKAVTDPKAGRGMGQVQKY